jgi:transcriptional regulator with XRE-family HTH domain
MNDDKDDRPLARQLSVRLRELRARHGLTQEKVAQTLGVHESAVSRWENGSRFPSADDLVLLSELYRVSTDHLLGKTRHYTEPGYALVDEGLLQRLRAAQSIAEFDRLIGDNEDQAVWLPVPEGSVVMPVADAMRAARQVADKFQGSARVDRLFRPRG